MTEYWYNIKTHEVEEDRLSDWSQLIGPYSLGCGPGKQSGRWRAGRAG
jgi:hypothetical protein